MGSGNVYYFEYAVSKVEKPTTRLQYSSVLRTFLTTPELLDAMQRLQSSQVAISRITFPATHRSCLYKDSALEL
jgi:hypothetical protein